MHSSHQRLSRLAAQTARRRALLETSATRETPGESPRSRITRLLHEAHRQLDTRDLADVLLSVRTLAEPLARGDRVASAPHELPASSWLSPAARVYVRPVHVALAERTRVASREARMRLADEVESLTDGLAALPRGCSAVA